MTQYTKAQWVKMDRQHINPLDVGQISILATLLHTNPKGIQDAIKAIKSTQIADIRKYIEGKRQR